MDEPEAEKELPSSELDEDNYKDENWWRRAYRECEWPWQVDIWRREFRDWCKKQWWKANKDRESEWYEKLAAAANEEKESVTSDRYEQIAREKDREADAATGGQRTRVERECERDADRKHRREHREYQSHVIDEVAKTGRQIEERLERIEHFADEQLRGVNIISLCLGGYVALTVVVWASPCLFGLAKQIFYFLAALQSAR